MNNWPTLNAQFLFSFGRLAQTKRRARALTPAFEEPTNQPQHPPRLQMHGGPGVARRGARRVAPLATSPSASWVLHALSTSTSKTKSASAHTNHHLPPSTISVQQSGGHLSASTPSAVAVRKGCFGSRFMVDREELQQQRCWVKTLLEAGLGQLAQPIAKRRGKPPKHLDAQLLRESAPHPAAVPSVAAGL